MLRELTDEEVLSLEETFYRARLKCAETYAADTSEENWVWDDAFSAWELAADERVRRGLPITY